ncbi:hypothetical protein V8B97DRAFT_1919403 [Scleroderma yunnanense]
MQLPLLDPLQFNPAVIQQLLTPHSIHPTPESHPLICFWTQEDWNKWLMSSKAQTSTCRRYGFLEDKKVNGWNLDHLVGMTYQAWYKNHIEGDDPSKPQGKCIKLEDGEDNKDEDKKDKFIQQDKHPKNSIKADTSKDSAYND